MACIIVMGMGLLLGFGLQSMVASAVGNGMEMHKEGANHRSNWCGARRA